MIRRYSRFSNHFSHFNSIVVPSCGQFGGTTSRPFSNQNVASTSTRGGGRGGGHDQLYLNAADGSVLSSLAQQRHKARFYHLMWSATEEDLGNNRPVDHFGSAQSDGEVPNRYMYTHGGFSSRWRNFVMFSSGAVAAIALVSLMQQDCDQSPYTEVIGYAPCCGVAHAATSLPSTNKSKEATPQGAKRQQQQQQPLFDYKAIVKELEALYDDDLSLAPAAVRLAWHAAGSWDATKKDGGSNTASMRFKKEGDYGSNNGLDRIRDALEPIKQRHPQISYADLWVLAAFTAISSAMSGPVIPFKWGRKDAADDSQAAPPGRLPDGSKTQDHVRCVFNRMGFDDYEITALLGAHAVGECHREYSGYVGPWTFDKYGFGNQFYTTLLENDWVVNVKEPVLQFTDAATKTLLMMPGDIAFLIDPKLRANCERFAKDPELWAKAFADAFGKMMEFNTSDLKPVAATSA